MSILIHLICGFVGIIVGVVIAFILPIMKQIRNEDRDNGNIKKGGITMGFVCPEWALDYWNPLECTIELCTDGRYAVVDHSIQTSVYIGKTKQECIEWLG